VSGYDPLAADSDSDGVSDKLEVLGGSNPMDARSGPSHDAADHDPFDLSAP